MEHFESHKEFVDYFLANTLGGKGDNVGTLHAGTDDLWHRGFIVPQVSLGNLMGVVSLRQLMTQVLTMNEYTWKHRDTVKILTREGDPMSVTWFVWKCMSNTMSPVFESICTYTMVWPGPAMTEAWIRTNCTEQQKQVIKIKRDFFADKEYGINLEMQDNTKNTNLDGMGDSYFN